MAHPLRGTLTSTGFLWLSLMVFIVLAIALLLPITPQDYWWYLALGKTILQTHSVPQVDTFSFTQAGQPTYYQAWLAAVIFWLIHRAGDLTLTFLLRGLALAATFGLLWLLMRRQGAGPRLASLLALVAALASSNNWSMRPQLLAYPLFMLTLLVLYDWLRGQNKRLWLLPVISLIWCNLHGSFVLFFLLAGSALLLGSGERKVLLPWLIAASAVIFTNARGLAILGDTVEQLRSTSNQAFSVEWHPPVNAGWQMNLFFGWLLLLAPMATISQHRISRLEWVWLLVFGWMALSGTRYVIWFLLLMALCSAAWLAGWGNAREGAQPAGKPMLNVALGSLLLILPLALLPGIREGWWKEAPLPYEAATTPVEATSWLSSRPELAGPMLADYAFSSYLEFALPERPTWIDCRFAVFPPAQWRRFQSLAAADPGWQQALDEEGINLLMLATVTEPRLIEALHNEPAWCQQYADPNAVIFARCATLP